MIELFIFHLHLMAGLYILTKNWQNYSLKDGFLAVGTAFLLFIMGWAIMGTVADIIYPDSLKNDYFTQDTLGLILLIIPELFFFNYFFVKK